jgi:hypothetical protein
MSGCVSEPGAIGCHISLHNDSMFGLTRCDFKDVHGGKLAEWKPPNITVKKKNAKWIDRLLGLMKKEGGKDE